MVANLVAEIFGIALTVLGVERYLRWSENRARRATRQLSVSSLGRRLDVLAQDWGDVLNFISSIGRGEAIDKMGALLESFREHLDEITRHLQRLGSASESRDSKQALNTAPDAATEGVRRMLDLKLEHIVGRLEDILNAVDAAGITMNSSMIDLLVQLRETALTNLRGIRDLRTLLGWRSNEQAAILFTSANSASFSSTAYLDLLEGLWRAIPGNDQPTPPSFGSLRVAPSDQEQFKLINDFLLLRFPAFDPKQHSARIREGSQ